MTSTTTTAAELAPAPTRRARRAYERGVLGARLDPRCNGLNLLRLLMAVGVVYYHSYRLTGRPIDPAPLEQALSSVWVDGFFALSGFLIVGSWMRRPQAVPFLRHRVLRIYPGFLVCLVLTAVVAVPLGASMTGERYTLADQLGYIGANLGLYIRTFAVGDTLAHVPFPGVWNGSLWTLVWEFACYLVVLALGLAGLLGRRHGVPVLFGGAWLLAAATALTPLGELGIPLLLYRFGTLGLHDAGRFALAFAAGALIFHLRDRLVCRWRLVATSLLIVGACMWLPDYRLVGAPFLAYALVAAGALIHVPRLHLRDDISYGMYIYAFPMQQLLAAAGLALLSVPVFAAASVLLTVVPARLSWFLVEKPAMRFKG